MANEYRPRETDQYWGLIEMLLLEHYVVVQTEIENETHYFIAMSWQEASQHGSTYHQMIGYNITRFLINRAGLAQAHSVEFRAALQDYLSKTVALRAEISMNAQWMKWAPASEGDIKRTNR